MAVGSPFLGFLQGKRIQVRHRMLVSQQLCPFGSRPSGPSLTARGLCLPQGTATTPTSSRPTRSRATTGPLRSPHSTTTRAVSSAHSWPLDARTQPAVGLRGRVACRGCTCRWRVPVHVAGGWRGLDWPRGGDGPDSTVGRG